MKKLMTLLIALALTVAMNFGQHNDHMEMGRDHEMMRHAAFGLGMVEKNLAHPRMLLHLSKEIGLTAQQEEKLRKMSDAHQEGVIRKNADLKVAELKFKGLLMEEKTDRVKVEGMIREIAKMKTDLIIDKINFLLDVKAALTADQVKKLEEMKRSRMHEMMRRRCPSERGDGPDRRRGDRVSGPTAPHSPHDVN